MKTLALTLAATLIASSSAFAGNTSFSTGDGFVRAPSVSSPAFDNEATASIGSATASGQVYTGTQFINGRDANIRYTLGADGEKNILSKSFRSSSR